MRHYSAAPAAVVRRQPWVDSLVLICTVAFGLLLGYFIVAVLPAGGGPHLILAQLARLPNPLLGLLPGPTVYPLQPAGVPQGTRGVVVQVAQPQLTTVAEGAGAPEGTTLLMVTAVVDNQGSQPFSFDLLDWTAIDVAGRVYDAESRQDPGSLTGTQLAPGQRVQGTLVFAVPQDVGPAQVRFGPPALRAIFRWQVPSTPGP